MLCQVTKVWSPSYVEMQTFYPRIRAEWDFKKDERSILAAKVILEVSVLEFKYFP